MHVRNLSKICNIICRAFVHSRFPRRIQNYTADRAYQAFDIFKKYINPKTTAHVTSSSKQHALYMVRVQISPEVLIG